MVAGDHKVIRGPIADLDASGARTGYLNLTGAAITYRIGSVTKTNATGGGITVVSETIDGAATDVVEITLNPADTNVPGASKLQHELQITDAAGKVSTVMGGPGSYVVVEPQLIE